MRAGILYVVIYKTADPLDVLASYSGHSRHTRNVRWSPSDAVIFGCNLNKRDSRDLRELPKTDATSKQEASYRYQERIARLKNTPSLHIAYLSLNSRENSSSCRTLRFNSKALAAFVPGFSPTTSKSVFRETLLLTFAPRPTSLSFASSLVIADNVPVSTKVLP